MTLLSQRYVNHGFFSSQEPTAVDTYEIKPAFIDVGGNGDCGFRAVAAGLIDNFLQHPRMNADLLNKVLACYFSYFPAHRTTLPGLVTAAERMQQLIKDVRMGDLISAAAYTLRQIAVTEMCTHPERYRGAFVERNEGTTPEDMRKSTTWIDESSIAALANALAISIEVQVVERGKTLPMRLRYNDLGAGTPPVVMQLKNGHYTPRVSLVERFTSVNSQCVRKVQPVNTVTADPELPEIYATIAREDERLVVAFENAYDRLALMVAAGELSKDDLLAMYVKGMADSDYLSGRITHVCIEHGNQHFFDAIIRAQRGSPQDSSPTSGNDKVIVDELIHALARAFTIGQMSADHVFASIDEKQDVSACGASQVS
jgi:hypothetical protein